MFVQHSVHIEHPVSVVSEALKEGPRRWFPANDKNISTVGIHVAGVPVRKKVVVELGEPVSATTWTVIPINWRATFPQQLFPAMNGKIEVAPTDAHITRLTVSGMYEPPLGKLGHQLDDVVMHNVAEATVRGLAETIAGRLEEAISPPKAPRK